MNDGSVVSAVLASAAIPGVFPPVQRNGRLLVDGALVDMVPAALARTLGADVVIAVDVSGTLPRREPQSLLEVLVAASTLPGATSDRLAVDADVVLSPAVDGYAFWELSRIAEFEKAGRAAAEDALPLMRALVNVAQARQAWRQAHINATAGGRL
jgi:NTE family protein